MNNLKSLDDINGGHRAIECSHKSFLVFKNDKVAIKEPVDCEYTIKHECAELTVYRQRMHIRRVYLVKGNLKDNILKYAKTKKKEELNTKEAFKNDPILVKEMGRTETREQDNS